MYLPFEYKTSDQTSNDVPTEAKGPHKVDHVDIDSHILGQVGLRGSNDSHHQAMANIGEPGCGQKDGIPERLCRETHFSRSLIQPLLSLLRGLYVENYCL